MVEPQGMSLRTQNSWQGAPAARPTSLQASQAGQSRVGAGRRAGRRAGR
jgi:hypothetical protein